MSGNPLAVVIGADDMSDTQMASFANWTNLSETTFLLKPTHPEADYRVRIFTPHAELPFAGHPTLGSCYVWLSSGGQPKNETLIQQCAAGLIKIRRDKEQLSFAAPALHRSGPIDEQTLARAIKGLGLAHDRILNGEWVDNGPGWFALRMASRAEVLALKPDFSILAGLRVGVVAPWDGDTHGKDADFEIRAFTAKGFEDPVTGSLNAGIAQWLIGNGIAPSNYIASQGTVLGRKGRVHVRKIDNDIWIGGQVTPCIKGVVSF